MSLDEKRQFYEYNQAQTTGIYISYSGTLIWNSIPLEIRNADTIGDFIKKCITWIKDLSFLYLCSHTSTAESFSMFTEPKCI